MSAPTTIRKISQFQPSGKELARQLSDLENILSDAIAALGDIVAIRYKPTPVKTANFQAQLQDLVVCSGTFTLILPSANKNNAGRSVAVLRKAGTVTVRSAETSLVQGGATDALSTSGLRVYYSDGTDWWRAP